MGDLCEGYQCGEYFVQFNGFIRDANMNIVGKLDQMVKKELIEKDEQTSNNWMDEARTCAASCWCDPETENKQMDPVLAEVVAKRIELWISTAAQNQRNADYYRGLLVKCGKTIGDRAFTCDDGSRSEDVLCAKIPDIIATDYVNGGA